MPAPAGPHAIGLVDRTVSAIAGRAVGDLVADAPRPPPVSREPPLSAYWNVGIVGAEAGRRAEHLGADLCLNTSHEPIPRHEGSLVPAFADETVAVPAGHAKAERLSFLSREFDVGGDAAPDWRG